MAANGKTKHLCPALPSAFSVKVTAPGLTATTTDEEAKKMAMARTRLFAESPVIRQMPRNTQGAVKKKGGKKG